MPGVPLWKILAAGEWKSPAFLEYLDVHKMEVVRCAVVLCQSAGATAHVDAKEADVLRRRSGSVDQRILKGRSDVCGCPV